MKKGTRVFIKTTNGGELVTELLEDYRPTYAAVVARNGAGYLIIEAARIKSIEPA